MFFNQSDVTFKFISDESHLLDVTIKPLLLDLCPFFFLWVGAILIEEHPCYSDHQDNIYP